MISLPKELIDRPAFLANNWEGYEHFMDTTIMPFNKLAFPSVNCTIPSRDKIVPDKGKTLLGQIFTENSGINGNLQKFKNLGGIEMEVRSNPSLGTNVKRDIIEIFFRNRWLMFSGIVGAFQVGETVVGGTSGSTGIIFSILNTVLTLTSITGDFVVGETITGGSSGATANVVSPPVSLWHQITENTNPLPRGPHEYYFGQWFDTNLNPALSKNLPRAIWVNGYEDPSTKFGQVYSWTGGIGFITAVTAGSISVDASYTWRSLGFTEDASGNVFVVVNGVSHAVPVPADLDTSTLNIASTAGIIAGNFATSRIETDISPIAFDVVRMNKGYVFYGDWKQRDLYMSNAFNRSDSVTVTRFEGGLLNDLVLNPASPYTGLTAEAVFHVVINTVSPDVEVQTFTGTGFNDAVYNTTSYSGTAGALNHYKISMMADALIALTAVVGFLPGETIKGSVSNAEAVVVVNVTLAGVTVLGVRMISGNMFDSATPDNIVGSATAGPGIVTQAQYQNWIQYTKNNVVVNVNTGSGSLAISPLQSATAITLSDGLTIQFANFRGHGVGDVFALDIRRGGIDTFQWNKNGGALSVSTPITTGFQTLSDGIQIKFLNFNGHTLGQSWDITARPSVSRAFDNFYYALPVRRPGEGYKFRLPSNFWTMDTQEEQMYVNCSYGEWSLVDTILSADLQSESVSLMPLKQAGSNKVLYPYLTGHMENDLVYVTENKTLDSIGRQKLLERPQVGYMSDPVKLDFLGSNFIGGRIEYFEKRLYVSSPKNGIMHTFDNAKGYWQPPKSFPEVAILSIFENNLITHSNTRNQTFTMFTNASDNGQGYLVEIRTPYTAVGDRWNQKQSNMAFTEGYITGNPKLIHTVYLGVNGCGGILPHAIEPIICLSPDRAPFGEGAFGSHSNGSDLDAETSHFAEVWKRYSPVMSYYFVSLGLSCIAKNHTYSILSLGLNAMYGESGNNSLVAPSNKVI